MDDIVKVIGVIALAAIAGMGISIIMAFPTMIVVNYLFTPGIIASLFGISQLTFWKAFWLMFLCGILFKGSVGSEK